MKFAFYSRQRRDIVTTLRKEELANHSFMTDQLRLRLRGSANGRMAHDRRLDTTDDANVDYWRSRSGWADDDETMRNYNEGVYSSYYGGDSNAPKNVGRAGSWSQGSDNAKTIAHLGWILGLGASLIFLILLAKCCSTAPPKERKARSTTSVKSSRDSSRSMRDKHSERRSRSRSHAASDRSAVQSRSKSRSRSKSVSAAGRRRHSDGGGTDSDVDYIRMGDEDDTRSRTSRKSRSRSRSSRSQSRSKSRRSSRSRSRKEDSGGEEVTEAKEQKMLV